MAITKRGLRVALTTCRAMRRVRGAHDMPARFLEMESLVSEAYRGSREALDRLQEALSQGKGGDDHAA
jgi:hypothetical protein